MMKKFQEFKKNAETQYRIEIAVEDAPNLILTHPKAFSEETWHAMFAAYCKSHNDVIVTLPRYQEWNLLRDILDRNTSAQDIKSDPTKSEKFDVLCKALSHPAFDRFRTDLINALEKKSILRRLGTSSNNIDAARITLIANLMAPPVNGNKPSSMMPLPLRIKQPKTALKEENNTLVVPKSALALPILPAIQQGLSEEEQTHWNEFARLYLDKDASENHIPTLGEVAKGKKQKYDIVYQPGQTEEQLKLLEDLVFGEDSIHDFLEKHLHTEQPDTKAPEYIALIHNLESACSAISRFGEKEETRAERRPLIIKIETAVANKWLRYRNAVQEDVFTKTEAEIKLQQKVPGIEHSDSIDEEAAATPTNRRAVRATREAILKEPEGALAYHCLSSLYEFTRDVTVNRNVRKVSRPLKNIGIAEDMETIASHIAFEVDDLLRATMFTHTNRRYLETKERLELGAEEEDVSTLRDDASLTTHFIANLNYIHIKTLQAIRQDHGLNAHMGEGKRNNHFSRLLSLDAPLANDDDSVAFGGYVANATPRPDYLVQQKDLRQTLENLLPQLNPREESILRSRFGLNDVDEARTLKEVGEDAGVTKERIRQIEEIALLKLVNILPAELRRVFDPEFLDFKKVFIIEDYKKTLNKDLIKAQPLKVLQSAQAELVSLLGDLTITEKVDILCNNSEAKSSGLLLYDDRLLAGKPHCKKIIGVGRECAMNYLKEKASDAATLEKCARVFEVFEYILNHSFELRPATKKAAHAR